MKFSKSFTIMSCLAIAQAVFPYSANSADIDLVNNLGETGNAVSGFGGSGTDLKDLLAIPFQKTAYAYAIKSIVTNVYDGSSQTTAGSMKFEIHSDLGGLPGALDATIGDYSFGIAPTTDSTTFTVPNPPPDIVLSPGTNYWLVASNGATAMDDNMVWRESTSAGDSFGRTKASLDGGSSWNNVKYA